VGWFRAHTMAALAVVSVILSAAIGIVSNVLVDSWGWALLTALLVLVSGLAIVEFTRNRADRAAGTPPSATPESSSTGDRPPGSITITGSKVSGLVAGRDVHQTRIGTGGFAAIAVAALLLGGGATYLGRTDAAIPKRALLEDSKPSTSPSARSESSPNADDGATRSSSPDVSNGTSSFRSSGSLSTNGKDLDPPAMSDGTADVSFESKRDQGGLSLLNGAALAPIPGDGRPTEAACRSADRYSTALVAMPISPGLSRCLRTSDERYGTLSVTSAESNALGGQASITWTVW
jgi:hypothetical protein